MDTREAEHILTIKNTHRFRPDGYTINTLSRRGCFVFGLGVSAMARAVPDPLIMICPPTVIRSRTTSDGLRVSNAALPVSRYPNKEMISPKIRTSDCELSSSPTPSFYTPSSQMCVSCEMCVSCGMCLAGSCCRHEKQFVTSPHYSVNHFIGLNCLYVYVTCGAVASSTLLRIQHCGPNKHLVNDQNINEHLQSLFNNNYYLAPFHRAASRRWALLVITQTNCKHKNLLVMRNDELLIMEENSSIRSCLVFEKEAMSYSNSRRFSAPNPILVILN